MNGWGMSLQASRWAMSVRHEACTGLWGPGMKREPTHGCRFGGAGAANLEYPRCP